MDPLFSAEHSCTKIMQDASLLQETLDTIRENPSITGEKFPEIISLIASLRTQVGYLTRVAGKIEEDL